MSVASYLTSLTPVPVGTVIYYAGQNVPRNYLLANGDTLLIADYPELFSFIGTLYGGDGVTNFAIPNLNVVVQGSLTNSGVVVPSTATGSTNVTLTDAQMPSLGAVGFSVVGGVGTASMDGGACGNIGDFLQGIGAEGKKVQSDSSQFGGDSSQLFLDENEYGLRDGASCVFSMGSATPAPIPVSLSGTVTASTLGLMPLIRYTNQLVHYANIPNAPYIPQTSDNPLSNIPTLSGYIYSQ